MVSLLEQLLLFLLLATIVCLTNLTASSFVCGVEDTNEEKDAFILHNKSFRVKCNFGTITSSKVLNRIELIESYSIEQNRATIQKIGINQYDTYKLVYDSETDKGLLNWPKLNETMCPLMDNLKAAQEHLYGRNRLLDLILFSRQQQQINNNVVIGLAQLLFLISSKADSLKPRRMTSCRNHASIEYRLDYSYDGRQVVLIIFYESKVTTPYEIRTTAIPLRVIVSYYSSIDRTTEENLIDFYGLKIINDDLTTTGVYSDEQFNTANDLSDKGFKRQYLLDHFAFPTAQSCSKELDKQDIFKDFNLNTLKFSFLAHTQQKHKSFKHFVAFDGRLQTMRIDTLRTSDLDGKKRDTLSLLDYKTNRKYTILESRLYTSNANDQQQQQQQLGEDQLLLLKRQGLHLVNETRCFVTNIMSPGKVDPFKTSGGNLRLSEFLFGTQKMVYMGRAQVRGKDAKVYEGYTNTLPNWFSEPLVFEWSKIGLVDYLERDLPVVRVSRSSSELVVVALITDNNNNDELLQVSIYKKIVGKKLEQYLIAQVNNFIWDLIESPADDRRRGFEMFSQKQEFCSVGFREDRYVELNLLLEADDENDQENSNSISSQLTNNWLIRNEALAVSMKDLLGVHPMMMYDLESNVIVKMSLKKPIINVQLRIAENLEHFYEITYLAQADFRPKGNNKPIAAPAKTFAECLWMVGKSTSPVYIYYSSFSKKGHNCLIDPYLMKNPNLNWNESKMFVETEYGLGEIFRIDLKLDEELIAKNSWLQSRVASRLENRVIFLDNVNSIKKFNQTNNTNNQVTQEEQLKMRVKKVNMNSFNYMSNLVSGIQVKSKRVISGFGLDESGKQNWPTKYSIQGELNSLEQCRASCLANLNCESYSYCLNYPQVQCLLSSLSFVDDEKVQSKLMSLKESNRRNPKSSSVKIDLKTSCSDQKQQKLELIRDFRCELYSKNYIELFIQAHRSRLNIQNVKIYPVSSEEHCAKLCFASSLEFIQMIGRPIDTLINELETKVNDGKFEIEQIFIRKFQDYKLKFCTGFMFFQLDDDDNEKQKQKAALKRHLKLESSSSQALDLENAKYYYCAIPSVKDNTTNNNNTDDVETLFLFHHYYFKYETLFESKPNFRLAKSKMTDELESAYNNVINHELTMKITPEEQKILLEALNNGHNFQDVVSAQEETCAMMCYNQMGNVWPSCKSFDYEFVYGERGVGFKCYLNSASIKSQFKQEDLIFSDDDENSSSSSPLIRLHFEPKFEFVGRQAQVLSEVTIGRLTEADVSNNKYSFIILFLISAASIGTGLVLGVKVARKIKTRSSKLETIIFSPSSTEFELQKTD